MENKIRVLLAGESWVSNSTHFKGWDFFSSTVYETGIGYLKQSLEGTDIDFTHLPGHLAAEEFPFTMDGLNRYDVIILSDLGANTLLLPPDVWLRGRSVPNRLNLLREWVHAGGGLAMCGGYYSFAGIYAGAKYYRTPIEEILPVNIYTFDDRVERPEGLIPEIIDADHPIVQGIQTPWPYLLGFNELTLKPDSDLVARVGDYPLLAVREVGQGRTLAWASDIGPHWCPEPFVTWPGYASLWKQAIAWLANKSLD
jgi:uncharacterized membrane protein